MQRRAAWLVLACVAWGARAGPGPPAPPAPALRFTQSLYNVTVPENSPPRTYCEPAPGSAPAATRLPAPGARLRFRIRHGDRDKFFKAEERCAGDLCFLLLRTRAGNADVLNRERRALYRLEVRATAQLAGGGALDADTVLLVHVADENDLEPLFYPTEYDVTVPEDAPLHASVARVRAEDADLGLNGEIYYSLAEPSRTFAVHPTSGEVTLTRPLSAAAHPVHALTVTAHDRASLRAGDASRGARAALTVRVARCNLHAPRLRARHLPEPPDATDAPEVYAIVEATDADAGDAGRVVALDIVDGDPDGHFRVRPSTQAGEWDVAALPLRDRATAERGYNLTLRATDGGRPSRSSYLTLAVAPLAVAADAPVFDRELYEARVPETAPPHTPVLRLKVAERDAGRRDARVYIEIVGGNEGGEFRVNPDTGVLYTALPLDAEVKALYHLTVSAIDRRGGAGVAVREQSSAKVQVTVEDANDNSPAFEWEVQRVSVPENGPAGSVVARVVARDADAGDNAYVSYSLANLQPVPFDVEPFTGAVRATCVLDYEAMRRTWELRVRASDWGVPYRRQAELRLEVRLEDVNDNRPQFERVECAGHLARSTPRGAAVVTLSAIDFDAGDAVSYRIAGGNEDGCFALDAATGVLSLACDLSEARPDTRLLNVTATDGTHFADATWLALRVGGAGASAAPALQCRDTGAARRLAELLAAAERANAPPDAADDFPAQPARLAQNLHAPEFIDFPVEVKVNESLSLGTTLVVVTARDRDLGYNGLVTYVISGGDPHSLFRVEPASGALQLIGYLDREREAEYFLNVTAWDQGCPPRAASRLLPVTVLDVNDNAPRFERALASVRLAESARNGTLVFQARATDADVSPHERLEYSLHAAPAPAAFCVHAATGALRVCGALDRETRAVHELTLRATDAGGLWAEARVRVLLDDVNDNPPRFPLAAYAARVREDVPPGTLVALLEAHDPDLAEGGRVLYSLADADSDGGEEESAFEVDSESGAVRTRRALDFETRQVHGVTVRARDAGTPALWSEATLVVELEDVDENAHAPRFAAPGVLTARVREDAAPGARVLLAAAADADPPGRDSRLAYYLLAGDGLAHFSVDDTGTLRTLAPLDRETKDHYWVTLCAQDQGLVPKHSCIEVYVEVEDVNDMAPWPQHAAYEARVPEGAASRAPVLRVLCEDADADAAPHPPPLRYAIVAGNPDGLFSIDAHTGELWTTGRALDRETRAEHALEVQCSDGELAGTARVHVHIDDVNDHAPAFTQRYYELRAPEPPLQQDSSEGEEGDGEGEGAGAAASAEWDSDDEEEGSGRAAAWQQAPEAAAVGAVHLATVLALDGDAGANGTVQYWARARGPARARLRVTAHSGRVLGAPGARLRAGDAFELALRACDGGVPARCGVARATVRVLAAGGGAPPRLQPPPPLQAAELDAPGFVLGVLQAADPDGDALYYDIVDGDPRRDWRLGREDGSLTVARWLRWETQPQYKLNVSVSDGLHAVFTTVVVNVVNDGDEDGVAFLAPQYDVAVSEATRPGALLARLQARAAHGGRLLYGLHAARAPASLSLFRLHEVSGALELAAPLDREAARDHHLTVWARDAAPRASRAFARVRVRVLDEDEHAPAWGRRLAEARLGRGAAPGALVAPLRARDADADAGALRYSLSGGDAGGLFAVDAALGDVSLARALPPAGPREYTLHVRAQTGTGLHATLPLHVLVLEPDDAPPRFTSTEIECSVYENEPAGTMLAALEARGGASLRYQLSGGAGLFRLDAAAGVLRAAAPLDAEAAATHNLTVTATNMGGGTARVSVLVHVLDRNEFPPVLRARTYRGSASEAGEPGAPVTRLDAPGQPLVLEVRDADAAAPRAVTFDIQPPAAAALFLVEPATGALRTRRALDYEHAARHEFTVRVLDAGEPPQPPVAASSARVIVDVLDVNDCAPTFERPSYEARATLPTVRGVRVLRVAVRDPDPPADAVLALDIISGDEAGLFALSARGDLTTTGALAAGTYRLRVRASDGRHASTARVTVTAQEAAPAGLAFQRAEYVASLPENSTKPTTVIVLAVLGAALDEHVEFRILNPTDGFEMGITSGAVRSTGVALDRESRDRYTLLVEARSGGGREEGGREARALLHLTVTDVNDNCPEWVELPYAAGVPAGADAGALVLRVRAHDADAADNGEVRYEMKRGPGDLFRVDRRSGEITLKRAPDARREPYVLQVAAFDGGVPACSALAEVTVRVWAGGAAPAWPRAHYALAAREDAAPGEALAAPLLALSPLQRPLIYTLLEAPPDLEIRFDTAPHGGTNPCVLVCVGALDYETTREVRGVLRAMDPVSGAHADAALALALIDVNDNAPAFARHEYRAAVTEAAPPGHLVLTVAATDPDSGPNGEVTYSLSTLHGEETDAFAVDAATGAVRVLAPLDADTRAAYHLRVTAADAGQPPLHSTAHLFITVEDVNDNAPRMERALVACGVSREAARGTALCRAGAWDADDLDAPRLVYRLEEGAGATPTRFCLHARTGVLSLAGALGPDDVAPRSLNVSVSDGAHVAYARLKLALTPTNTRPPAFPHQVQEARAPENRPPPLLLTTLKAHDPDAGEYGVLSYSIPSERLRATFGVDARSGALSALVALDREARAEWLVPVLATDGGGLVAHTLVRVRVEDANDNAPEFPLREYRASVPADAPARAPFLTLAATDADVGDHARLTYSLHEGEEQGEGEGQGKTAGLFHVEPTTGALSFARNASSFAGRSVQVWVRARDAGGRAGEAPVAVHVLTRGTRAPVLRPPPPELALPEDAEPGAVLADLQPPPGARLRLAAARHPPGLFALDAAGRLLLAGRLDRETAPRHVIGVIAEGVGSPAPAVMVQTVLRVVDVNEHAPVFHSQPYVVHLAENTPPHSSVIQLMADDADSGSNGEVRFSFAPPDSDPSAPASGETDAEGAFAVDPFTGWVTTLVPLDREARPEHRLALVAADGGSPRLRSRGTLLVRLVDHNDCPPRFERTAYECSVREDAPPGTVVTRLALTDADATQAPLSFFVAEGDERARFQLRSSGELHVARALDRELQPEHRLRVAATDGKFTAYADVTVAVLDVNDNAPYCVRHGYSVRVREDAAPGTPLLTLETRDADSPEHARLRYYLSGAHHHHFAVDRESGAVSVAAPLDREALPAYALTAHAEDRARADWTCASMLDVRLDDVNDNAPRFSADTYSVTLPEDADPGTVVAKVDASDCDLGENRTVRYSWLAGSEGGGAFSLDALTGVVTLSAALDRETQASHRGVVVARDAGRPPRSATATLRLSVADVNDNPPEFQFRVYRAAVSELDAPGAEVLRVRATSRDAGVNADVSYGLLGGDGAADFSVDAATGAVRVARPLDYERRAAYLLTVQAVDGGVPPLSDLALLNLTVLDANDNAPQFPRAEYAARVREDAAPGALLLRLTATDADAGANGRVRYSLARGDPTGRFAVDAQSGQVSLAAALDREAQAAYALEVVARDGGVPALEGGALVRVTVLDANDNAPRFTQDNYSCVVREDRPLGHALLHLEVTDADAPPNAAPFTFDFQAGNEMGAFRLDQDGYLRSARRFDHRLKDSYVLLVRVFDNGVPPLYADASVHVRVREQSHYPPVASALHVLVASYRDRFPGGALARVHAADRDADDTLLYALQPAHALFRIHPASGELSAAPALDVGDYRLNVTVSDGKFLVWTQVHVHVALVSDDALAAAVVVRFRAVSDEDFVLRHRRGFLRAVADATDAAPADVLLISVQPSGEPDDDDDDDDADAEPEGEGRARRQVARDLDVAFAVRAGGDAGWMPAEALRRCLHAHVSRLEERAQLVVEQVVRATCADCARAACSERVWLAADAAPRRISTELVALVAPRHALRGHCATADGGAARVLVLRGDGYLEYMVERGSEAGARALEDELVLALRFRTARARGTLAACAGAVDGAVLEVADGFLQFRWELGAGAGVVRAPVPVADGRWHEARLERRGAGARLTVDRRGAQAHSPPPHVVLDVSARRLLVGAQLVRHAHAAAPEQVTDGFDGCISELRFGGVALPLDAGASSADGRVQLARRVRVRAVALCPARAPSEPSVCAAQPCAHGGTCRAAPAVPEGFACACHARYRGARCELDSAPCASQPCLHGGTCSDAGAGAFACACPAALTGARCEFGRYCPPLPAAPACRHGGVCEEGDAGPSCVCRGYFGARCDLDVDECAGEPCLNGATCLNEPGSFRCLCPPDRTGMHCGNPLHSDAVTAGGASGARALGELWRWALAARWPLVAGAMALGLLVALALVPWCVRRRRVPPPALAACPGKLGAGAGAGTKLSNLEAVRRERPASCLQEPPLNNVDTLRSYGSAGDELEGIPPDYRRNLNIDADRKPWSEQMHLHTFVDNKIYNDLKGTRARYARPPPSFPAAAGGEPHLVGGYHWDCSDWCGGGGALPGISEVAGSERPDSSSAASPRDLPLDTDSAPDELDLDRDLELELDLDADLDEDAPCLADASSYLLHPDAYLPRACADVTRAGADVTRAGADVTRAGAKRDADAASLITMLEERASLLDGGGSPGAASARLCEIEDSDADDAGAV